MLKLYKTFDMISKSKQQQKPLTWAFHRLWHFQAVAEASDNLGSTPSRESRGGFRRYAIRGKVGHIKGKQKKLIARRRKERANMSRERCIEKK
jgi:hypothetical protein